MAKFRSVRLAPSPLFSPAASSRGAKPRRLRRSGAIEPAHTPYELSPKRSTQPIAARLATGPFSPIAVTVVRSGVRGLLNGHGCSCDSMSPRMATRHARMRAPRPSADWCMTHRNGRRNSRRPGPNDGPGLRCGTILRLARAGPILLVRRRREQELHSQCYRERLSIGRCQHRRNLAKRPHRAAPQASRPTEINYRPCREKPHRQTSSVGSSRPEVRRDAIDRR